MIGIGSRGHGGNGKPAGVGGRLGASLFFFFFFAIGSLFEVLVLREFLGAVAQRTWKKVPCTVASSRVVEGDEYAFAVNYRYECGGQPYTGSIYKRGYSASEKYSDAQKLAKKYPAGLKTSCYVKPGHPGTAVLRRDSLLIGLVFFFPLIFVAIGAGGIYFTWCKQPAEEARPIAAGAAGKRGTGKYGMAALFAVFTLVGAGMLYPLGIRPIARTIDAKSWITTPCRVLRAEVRSHDSDDGTTYSIYILYQYRFNGQTYKSDRYDFIGGSSSGYQGKARLVAAYQADRNPVCYVNPDDPSEAVLKRGFHAKLLLALLPLPFLLIGIGGLVHVVRGKSPGNVPAAEAWIAQPPERVVLDDVAVLRASDAGRVRLAPKYSARMKFVGMVLAAAFWNGIVSVFVVGTLRDPHVFRVLFMLPFVAVGLGLIVAAVYFFLATFNPRPALELSSDKIRLGGAAELRWSLDGQTSRIDEFTVTLRGVEEAKYRRGTSTYTDRNTFYEMELYRTSRMEEIASGQVGFIMPQDTMHSFEAENNKILWNLDVRGSIRNWPDVKESFKITVAPAVA